ncbi:MAG: hypothetical protein DLM67_18480, partial [Candidatus Nephthysia bennettiae]
MGPGQGALDRWTQAPGRSTTLVGLTGFQHAMFTLADLTQPAMPMYGLGVGAVAMARLASGPSGATRACVRCGLYLVNEGETRLALLLREGKPPPRPGADNGRGTVRRFRARRRRAGAARIGR